MATSQIDYLSFSVDLVNKVELLHDALLVTKFALKQDLSDKWMTAVIDRDSGWTAAHPMRPYRFGVTNEEIGCHIHFGGHSNALVQFSGAGCKFLAMEGLLMDTIVSMKHRMTRIDMAIDIETTTSPEDFINAGYNNRIKSKSVQTSPSGQTAYIGSRTSAKFCRVYRYEPPHPRAKLLRVEYETKKSQAKIVAECIANDGINHTIDRITKYYDWSHKDMPSVDDIVTAIPSEVQTRSDSKTLTWLLKTCAPAFRRLVQNGSIQNPEQTFKDHFLPATKQERLL